MSETAIIARLFLHAVLLGALGEPEIGVGAYAVKPDTWYNVCERRMTKGWAPPGVVLDCTWECLVAGIEQNTLGQWWAVDVPGASMHL